MRMTGKFVGVASVLFFISSSPLLCGCYVIECIIFQIKPCNLYPVGINYR